MKDFMGLVLIVVFGIGIWSCQYVGLKTGEQSHIIEKENKSTLLNNELQEVNQLVYFGNRARSMNDTLGADFYYKQALQKLDSLTLRFSQDSTFALKRQEVMELYQDFSVKFAIADSDTISTDEVIEDLSMINEKIDTSKVDSSTVTIEDVIDEAHEMKIPLVLNKKVERTIEYFSRSRGRKIFSIWLQRAGKYEKLIKNILKEEGVPEELFYLAMIESGLRPVARSWAKAVGIWQFIYGTGHMYGLKASWWFDERRDPVKSTRAAASHLKDLYARFGDWYLAMAGYNYSPAKIERRLSRYGVTDYWDLPRLPRETRNYVPTFIAAATMAQNPEKYGFTNIEADSPLEMDTVTVHECVDLNIVAQCVNNSFTEIKNMNPALLRWCTPPDMEKWVLNLPKGTREIFLANYAKIPDNQKVTWMRHRIRSGETLSTISRRYGVSINEIKRFNHIRGSLIRAGSSLVIPVPQNKNYYKQYASYSRPSRSAVSHSTQVVTNVPGREKRTYQIKKGDTLWDIANLFGVRITDIRKWNGLGYSSRIYPNQKLNIWVLPNKGPVNPGILAEGTRDQNIDEKSSEKNSTDQKSTTYVVRYGDTLWDISQSFNVSIRDIKKWNNKRNNMIKPGEKLTIITGE